MTTIRFLGGGQQATVTFLGPNAPAVQYVINALTTPMAELLGTHPENLAVEGLPEPEGEPGWVFDVGDEEAKFVTIIGRNTDGVVEVAADGQTWSERPDAVFATRAEAEADGFAILRDRAAAEIEALREQLAAAEAAQAGFDEARQRAAAEVQAAKGTP